MLLLRQRLLLVLLLLLLRLRLLRLRLLARRLLPELLVLPLRRLLLLGRGLLLGLLLLLLLLNTLRLLLQGWRRVGASWPPAPGGASSIVHRKAKKQLLHVLQRRAHALQQHDLSARPVQYLLRHGWERTLRRCANLT